MAVNSFAIIFREKALYSAAKYDFTADNAFNDGDGSDIVKFLLISILISSKTLSIIYHNSLLFSRQRFNIVPYKNFFPVLRRLAGGKIFLLNF